MADGFAVECLRLAFVAGRLNEERYVKVTMHSSAVPRTSVRFLGRIIFAVVMCAVYLYWVAPLSAAQAGSAEIGPVTALAISRANTQVIYAGTYGGVWKSTNGGGNWTNANLNERWILSLAVNPTNSRLVFAVTDNGVFVTSDGGRRWTKAGGGMTARYATSVVIDPANPDVVYVGSGCGGDPGLKCPNGGIFKSTDGGKSWMQKISGLTTRDRIKGVATPDITCIAAAPADPQVVYSASSRHLFRSANGGETWSELGYLPVLPFVPAGDIHSLAVDPVNPEVVYAGAVEGGAFKSTNGGKSWIKINSGLGTERSLVDVGSIAICPNDPKTIYATSYPGVFKSVDGGRSWAPASKGLPTPGGACLIIDPVNPSTLFIGGSYDVFKSIDRAKSWTAVNLGLKAPVSPRRGRAALK